MKKALILATLVVLPLYLWATPITRKQDIDDFLKTTTYVVLDDNAMTEWNFKIQEAVEKFWTITPYKFITRKEFDTLKNDMDKSFLVRLQFRWPKDKIKATYNFMCLVLGAAVDKPTDMPEICSIPLGYESANQMSWGYKLAGFLRFIQAHIRRLQENPSLISSEPLDFYNKNIRAIGDHEIWVVRTDLAPDIRSLEQLRKNYSGVIRVVKPEDIEKAINEKNEHVIYLHKVGPESSNLQARVYKVLLGAGDDNIYYFDYHMMSKSNGDGLLKKDLKRMSR